MTIIVNDFRLTEKSTSAQEVTERLLSVMVYQDRNQIPARGYLLCYIVGVIVLVLRVALGWTPALEFSVKVKEISAIRGKVNQHLFNALPGFKPAPEIDVKIARRLRTFNPDPFLFPIHFFILSGQPRQGTAFTPGFKKLIRSQQSFFDRRVPILWKREPVFLCVVNRNPNPS